MRMVFFSVFFKTKLTVFNNKKYILKKKNLRQAYIFCYGLSNCKSFDFLILRNKVAGKCECFTVF